MSGSMKIALGVVGVAVVAFGAYKLGQQQTAPPVAVAPAPAAPPAAQVAAPANVPPAHPPVAPQQQPANPHAGMPTTDPGMGARASSGIRFAHFKVGNSNVKALLIDGPIVWVGTSGGVVRYDTQKDEHRLYDVRAGLLSNGIFHLSKLGDRLVVGTYGGGLSLFDEAKDDWVNYNVQHGLGDAFIYDFLQMPNGDIWIATWSGANLIKGGDLDDAAAWSTFTVANTEGGLPNDWVYGLAKGKDGEVWMATEGGLARYKDGQWQNWKHADGLGAPYELVKAQIKFTRDPAKESSHHARQKVEMGLEDVDIAYNPNYIVALHVAADGVVWAGTWGGGLARFDGKEWKYLTMADGLPANHVFMLAPASDGNMWVGTSAGMAHYDGKRFKVFNKSDGIYSDAIFSFAEGENDTLWVGSFGGVAKLTGMNAAAQKAN